MIWGYDYTIIDMAALGFLLIAVGNLFTGRKNMVDLTFYMYSIPFILFCYGLYLIGRFVG